MSDVARWRADLMRLDRSSWPEFLDAHSGLPGPRANLALAAAVADLADAELTDALLGSDDEYRVLCGAVALGALAAQPGVAARLRELAADHRWRVREGVAMGLQRLGDTDVAALESLVLDWADDPEPLVQRAAAAAICEPRLLGTAAAAATAIEVCRRATASLAARPPSMRRQSELRTLRQGLGYCWSVAIAADPGPGLAAFRELDERDRDVAWIVTQNRRKARLARLVEDT
ncbi:HEAT repeat domain-containing protein [Aeromicrobium sp. YIM 150415]|uniref:HEAT repeat domain-containing protein n=1 Tax=Aeromicrobium sp. YIM 150415 TaxID=2803912 RepID=UPI0019653E4C|nr:HEAT repeat domain-containing protein [Aeromicrobium sp. YIM 150415]MBM9465377.1 HEAT repeat domain-containing protein [Aeromicrobium sp. YIM 150415]